MSDYQFGEKTGIDFPCKSCLERVAGCHATCERYKAEKEAHVAKAKEIREERKTEFKLKMARIASKRRRLEYERNKNRK